MDQLFGITAGDWGQLLRENRFAIAPRYTHRALFLTLVSLMNSRYRKKEERLYGEAIADVEIQAPLFILGHWRNGTTPLHYLLTQDKRFTYANIFQVANPHTFLCREDGVYRQSVNDSSQKRPMDNMRFTTKSPGEDEFALSAASLRSPLIGWSFPRRAEHYDRYLTFRGVAEKEVKRWKMAFVTFLKKLTWKYKRPLILKSPAHTARIRLLLEMFPDARFIHIYRDPYTVFQSMQRLYARTVANGYLQHPDDGCVNAAILRRYKMMYDALFEERDLIPEGQFYELRFEDFEKDMLGQAREIYEHLNIPGFQEAEPAFRRYVDSIAGYKKNVYPPLSEPLRQRVAQAWQRSFEEWGYAV